MWECRECGKKFHTEPIFCDFCGATGDFLKPLDQAEVEAFYRDVENSFNANVSARGEEKSFEDYDALIRDFLSDEYNPIDTRVKEPFEDEERERAARKAKEEKLATLDAEYYASLKHLTGEESEEKDDYYKNLEGVFGEELSGGHETTFNGIFREEDTMENTFLKPKPKTKRAPEPLGGGAPNSLKRPAPVKTALVGSGGVKKRFSIPVLPIPLPDLSRVRGWISDIPLRSGGNVPNRKPDSPAESRKLIKALVGVGVGLVLMVVLMTVLITSIVDSGDNSGSLPTENTLLKFFSEIKSMDEATFVANPSMVSFYGYAGDVNEKQTMLKNLYALASATDTKVDGANNIVQKGINRIQADFAVSGSAMAKEVFDQLLFRTTDKKTWQLDFADFVIQYTIATEKLKPATK